MVPLTRRRFLAASGSSATCMAGLHSVSAFSTMLAAVSTASGQSTDPKDVSVEQWMEEWMSRSRAPAGTLHVSRFKDPIYFLTKPIAWVPNSDQTQYQAVRVPIGFVTDFASVPRAFWSFLRPDGEYTYPAIVHDYMYWMQDQPRNVANEILRLGMQDFGIDQLTISTIYQAVRIGGGSAWEANAALKARGEKRVLKAFPEDPTITWETWKTRPDVFA